MMNKQQIVFLLVFLLVASSCSTRYSSLQKVKRHNGKPATAVFAKSKKHMPPALAAIKPAIPINTGDNNIIIAAPTQQTATPAKKSLRTIPPPITGDSISTTDTIKPPPDIREVKLNRSNFAEAANAGLIVTLISFLVAVFGHIVFFVLLITGIIYSFGFLGFIAATAIIGAVLSIPVFFWLRSRIRKHKHIKIKYGQSNYTVGDVKNMPRDVKMRRAFHNSLAAFLLCLIVAPVCLLLPPLLSYAFGLLFCAIFYFIKMIFTKGY